MILQLAIVGAVGAVPMFLLWSFLHEMLHVVMAEHRVGVRDWSINLIPHRYKGSWRWASCTWVPAGEVSERDRVWISLAPRIPDVGAALLFPAFSYLPEWAWAGWFILFGAGLVDLGVGSMGRSEHSDLRRAAESLEISPWWLRLAGWAVLVLSVVVGAVLAFLNWA